MLFVFFMIKNLIFRLNKMYKIQNKGGIKMGLTNKKEEQLKKMPIVEARVAKSKDGKYLVHRTVITDIKPVEYYKVVMDSTPQEGSAAETDTVSEESVEA